MNVSKPTLSQEFKKQDSKDLVIKVEQVTNPSTIDVIKIK